MRRRHSDPGSNPHLQRRITESPDGGWGIGGVANTGADGAKAAREELDSDRHRVNELDS